MSISSPTAPAFTLTAINASTGQRFSTTAQHFRGHDKRVLLAPNGDRLIRNTDGRYGVIPAWRSLAKRATMVAA